MNNIVEIKTEDVLDYFRGGTEVLVTDNPDAHLIPGSKIRHKNSIYVVESVSQGRRMRILLKMSKIKESS